MTPYLIPSESGKLLYGVCQTLIPGLKDKKFLFL